VAVAVVFIAYTTLSVSRVASMTRNFSAPLRIGMHLYFESPVAADARASSTPYVCMGQEWYRFPSHFFLSPPSKLGFLPSHFKGQLPQPFGRRTYSAPAQPFNDLNKEEPSRYVSLTECEYFIEFFPGVDAGDADATQAAEQARFAELGGSKADWQKIVSIDLMDADRSASPYRAFYLPSFLSKDKVKYSPYALYRRRAFSEK
jgi:alpha-1,2-mannosyltransferase